MTTFGCERDCDLAELEALGRRLGEVAGPGLLTALIGGLGAGKTTFVRAVVAGAGGDPRAVSSPTFVLVHEYDARSPILHLDVYRLRSPAEFLELGVLESLPEALMLVEWADRVADHLPSDRLEVELTPTSESTRRVAIRALGPQAAVVAARLRSLG